jgi:hypothetical protein|tara:strand:- start:826 stop:1527 length:702 start_codon:yes stop_codon:yes gene_type:complete
MEKDDRELAQSMTEITREEVSPEFLERRPGFKASRGTVHPEVARDRKIQAEWDAKRAAHRAEQKRIYGRNRARSGLDYRAQPSWGEHLDDVDSNVPRFIESLLGPEGQERAHRENWLDEISGLAGRKVDATGELMGILGIEDPLKPRIDREQTSREIMPTHPKTALALESGNSTEAALLDHDLSYAEDDEISEVSLGGGRTKITVGKPDSRSNRASYIYDENTDELHVLPAWL